MCCPCDATEEDQRAQLGDKVGGKEDGTRRQREAEPFYTGCGGPLGGGVSGMTDCFWGFCVGKYYFSTLGLPKP